MISTVEGLGRDEVGGWQFVGDGRLRADLAQKRYLIEVDRHHMTLVGVT